MDWTVIIVAALAFLAFVIWCATHLQEKRLELEIEKQRPRKTLFGEVERTGLQSAQQQLENIFRPND